MGKKFIPGLKISKLFFKKVVKPIITKHYPTLKYAAALIGEGSEVIKNDDETSMDHNWGLRLYIFLKEKDFFKYKKELDKIFSKELPYTFMGHSTNWEGTSKTKTRKPVLKEKGKVSHRIEISTVKRTLKSWLDIEKTNLSDKEWLLIPEQRLIEFTAGEVYHDSVGELTKARDKLKYYPDNVWKFMLWSQWEHIHQEKAFIGRTGSCGDELGSRIEAAREVKFIMRLCYLLEKKYISYAKWFGTEFNKLTIAKKMDPLLLKVLKAKDWRERERYLCDAYILLVKKQNKLKITPKLNITPGTYFARDQLVIKTEIITEAIKKTIKSPLRELKYPIGNIDQFVDDTLIQSDAKFAKKLKRAYF